MRTWLVGNPVLRRELLERWRGRRGFVILTVYLAGITLLVMGMAWIISRWIEDQANFNDAILGSAGPMMGRGIFENLLALVLFFVLFFTPAYAAAQVSGERERRTLPLLQVSLVRPAQIVAGKLSASVAWLLVLIVAAAPIAATGFFLGGVNIGDLIGGLTLIVIVAVSVAAVAIGLSSIVRKTTTAIILTYVFVLSLLIGPLFGSLVEAALRDFEFEEDERPYSLYVEPYYGLADAVGANRFGIFGGEFPSLLTPFTFLLPETQVRFVEPGPFPFDEDIPEGAPGVGFEDDFIEVGPEPQISSPPVWEITAGIHLLLGALGFALATRNVQPGRGPRRRISKAERAEMAGAVVTIGPPPDRELRHPGSFGAGPPPDDPGSPSPVTREGPR